MGGEKKDSSYARQGMEKKTWRIILQPSGSICRWTTLFLMATTVGITSVSVSAQSTPDAGSLLRDQQQIERRLPTGLPEAEAKDAVRSEMKEIPGVKVTVKEIRFSGANDLVEEAELRTLLQDAINREHSFTELQALADKVTKHLKSKGFFLARAYLPNQDITDGNLEIAILPGRLDGSSEDVIDVRGENLRIPEQRLKDIASKVLTPGEVTQTRDMERALLLMNDLPGVSAKSTLSPGKAPGSSRLIVEAQEGPFFSGSAWIDNYGNRYNGAVRANALFNLNDPFGFADQFNVLATVAEDLTSGMVGYRIPLGASGLKFAANYSYLKYETGKELSSLNLKGNAKTFSTRISYPFIRSRKVNVNGIVGYEWKALKDEAAGITVKDKRGKDYSITFTGNRLDGIFGGGLTGWSVGLVAGDLDLSRVPADLAADQTTAMTDSRFNKFTYNLGRLQKLPKTFTLYAGIIGQLTDNNLDSSEEFSLGGPYGVRAYPVSEGAGDEGWLANFELRYDVPKKFELGNLQLVAFFDTGETKLYDDPYSGAITTATRLNRYHLSGAGVGATLLNLGTYSVRAVWANPIGDNPGRSTSDKDADGKDHDSRFWLQAMVWF